MVVMMMILTKRKAMERVHQPQQRKKMVEILDSLENEEIISILLGETNEAKSHSQENEPEAGEVPDAPRSFHRTLSIFFRHLPMQTTKDDLENVPNSSRLSSSSLYLVMQKIFRFSSCLYH